MANDLQGKKQVDEITKAVKEMTIAVSESVKVFESFNKTVSKAPSQHISNINKAKAAQDKQNKTTESARVATLKLQKQREQSFDKFDKQLKREQTARERQVKSESDLRQRLLTQRKKEEAQTIKQTALERKLSSAFSQLNVSLNKAEKNYRDLAASMGIGNKRTIKARKEVLKLRKQLDGINKPIKRWNNNVGNYASGLSGLAGALGWAGLTFAIINGIKATFDTIKIYDALLKSIDKVTSSQQEAASEFAFVVDITERLGLNLRATTSDYVKFLASVKGTNLEGKEARKIFESVAKSASSMGLSAEETSGTLRALNQIISKGKVQAEELRGQLGDRIPGAFQIMARAIGVTTAKLDEMLKQGKLIADEVLPRFAAEMEKTFGVENVDRINTLVAAQNRLSTSWDKLILGITEGDDVISRFISTTLKTFSFNLNAITAVIRGFEGVLNDIETKEFAKKLDEIQASKFKDDIKELQKELDKVNTFSIIQEIKRLKPISETFLGIGSEIQRQAEKQLKVNQRLLAQEAGRRDALKTRINQLKQEKSSLIDKIVLIDKTLKQSDLEAKSLIKLRELFAKLNKEKGIKLDIARKGSIAFFEKIISALEKEQKNTATNAREWGILQKQIDETTESLDRFLIEINGLGEIDAIGDLENSWKRIQEILTNTDPLEGFDLDKANKELEEWSNNFEQQQKITSIGFSDEEMDLLSSQFDVLGDLYNIDASKFAALFDQKENTVADYVTASGEALKGLYNGFAENYEDDLERLRISGETALLFANGNIEAEEEIRSQVAEKERKIKNKQAKQDRDAALFQIFINTATAVTQALPNIPLSIIVGALGVAQALAVSSRDIPQFKDGGITSGGDVLVNDNNTSNFKEVIKTPDGNIIRPQKRNTILDLPKGSEVFKNENEFEKELQKMLNFNGILPERNLMPVIKVESNGISKQQMGFMFKSLEKTINKKVGVNINIDKSGFHTSILKGYASTEILNNRFSFKGKNV